MLASLVQNADFSESNYHLDCKNSVTPLAASSKLKLKWRLREKLQKLLSKHCIRSLNNLNLGDLFNVVIQEINQGFSSNINPRSTNDGSGGSYILSNREFKPIAIFKPFDEEAFTPNNPCGYVGKLGQVSFRPGVLSGTCYLREVAIFALDKKYGSFSNVPPTFLVEALHSYFCYDAKNPKITRDKECFFEGLQWKKKKTSG